MILNEDYFNDLEITDDDIADNTVPIDTDAFFEQMSSEYTHILTITTDIRKPFQNDDLWKSVSHLLKRVEYLLDTFGIRHSKPLGALSEDWYNVICTFNIPENYGFIDFKGTRIFSRHKYMDEMLNDDDFVKLIVFIDFPELKSPDKAFKIICNLTKSVYRTKQDRYYFMSFCITKHKCYIPILNVYAYDVDDIIDTDNITGPLLSNILTLCPQYKNAFHGRTKDEMYRMIRSK